MILLIDNYDSFTYNLYQYFEELGAECRVVRNDALSVDEVSKIRPQGIVLSPGPGNPDGAGICIPLIRSLGPQFPILGICLGHQAIGAAFGGKVTHARQLRHGKTSPITHEGTGLFRGLSNPFKATRYHSLVVEADSMPSCLAVTATTEDGVVMGIRHREYAVQGVQFHPESILTEGGKTLLSNFLESIA